MREITHCVDYTFHSVALEFAGNNYHEFDWDSIRVEYVDQLNFLLPDWAHVTWPMNSKPTLYFPDYADSPVRCNQDMALSVIHGAVCCSGIDLAELCRRYPNVALMTHRQLVKRYAETTIKDDPRSGMYEDEILRRALKQGHADIAVRMDPDSGSTHTCSLCGEL